MPANTNLERLLPSLYTLLCADPVPSRDGDLSSAPHKFLYGTTGLRGALSPSSHSPSSTAAVPPFSPHNAGPTVNLISSSYQRWRRCITVWRTVVGNDILFLALLLHAGCLWSPDYAALHQAKHRIHAANVAQEQRRRHAAGGHPKFRMRLEETASAPVKRSPYPTEPSTPSSGRGRGRGRRGGQSVAEVAAARLTSALVTAADAHAQLEARCPASLWALHVLHFLRVEEVYAVPKIIISTAPQRDERSTGERSVDGYAGGTSRGSSVLPSSTSHATSLHSDTVTSTSVLSPCSSSESVEDAEDDEAGQHSGELRSGATPIWRAGGGQCGRRVGLGESQNTKRQHPRADGDKRGAGKRGQPRGVRPWKRHRCESPAARERNLRSSSAAATAEEEEAETTKRWAASSSLLPKVSLKHNSAAHTKHRDGMLSSVLSALYAREKRGQPRAVDSSSKAEESPEDGAAGNTETLAHQDSGIPNGVYSPAVERKALLLLRATVTIVSEEEPLVQRVATMLVNEWLSFFTVEAALSKEGEEEMGKKTEQPPLQQQQRRSKAEHHDGYAEESYGGVAHGGCEHNRSELPTSPASVQEQQRSARHYWLSCLLKMVAYLDGVHSALRDENAHLEAVMARQGIAPHNAEDIFTKSLPAILNCVLAEEVLQNGPGADTAVRGVGGNTNSAPSSAPQLWMPPLVLLLPFQLLGRGSVMGIWVPNSMTGRDAATSNAHGRAAAPSTRSQGRYVSFIVESYGLHLAAEPHPDGCVPSMGSAPEMRSMLPGSSGAYHAARCTGKEDAGPPRQLGFGVRLMEPEPEPVHRGHNDASLDSLFPSLGSVHPTTRPDKERPVRAPAHAPGSLRWWACGQPETCGCVRMDLYVARTLLMLPIPVQSAFSGATHLTEPASRALRMSAADPERGSRSGGSGGARQVAETGNGLLTAAAPRRDGAVPRGRPGRRVGRRSAPTQEELVVRRQHHLLYQTISHQLRATPARAVSGSTVAPAEGTGAAAQLVLLGGLPRGEEISALRRLGFTVRTGTHHGLGRGGGTSGHGRAATGAPTGSSNGGTGNPYSSGGGRRTLARDPLGTTLEGMLLVARRLLGLHGVFLLGDSASVGSPYAMAKGRAPLGGHTVPLSSSTSTAPGPPCTGAAHATAPTVEVQGDAGRSRPLSSSATVSCIDPQHESVALGTIAVDLALTCLVLSHSLFDELLEQPSLVLWATELASFVQDVSLLMPRPMPRLLKACGCALALLLRPAQSLLLMVGLAATLVTREAHLDTASATQQCGGDRGHKIGKGAPTGGVAWRRQGATRVWHPWWSLFRAVVLRDAVLPSCLHPGVWSIVERAERDFAAAVAVVAHRDAPNRAVMGSHTGQAHKPSEGEGGDRGLSRAALSAAPSGGRRGGKGGRHIMALSHALHTPTETTALPADRGVRHRLLLVRPAVAAAGAASGGAQPSSKAAPQWLCGPAVLYQGEDVGGSGRAGGVPSWRNVLGLRVVPSLGEEAAATQRSSHDGAHPTFQGVNPVVASALWLSLEAEGMGWPSSRTADSECVLAVASSSVCNAPVVGLGAAGEERGGGGEGEGQR